MNMGRDIAQRAIHSGITSSHRLEGVIDMSRKAIRSAAPFLFWICFSAVGAAMLGNTAAHAGVVAHWKMDEPTGDLVADETGVHDGTAFFAPISPGPNLPGLGGTANLARLFVPTDDRSHVLVPDHPDWDLGGQFTIEAWARPTSTVPRPIVDRSKFSGAFRLLSFSFGTSCFNPPCSALALGLLVGGTEDVFAVKTPDGSVATNEWQWFAATFNAGVIRLYINGTPVASGTVPITTILASDGLLLIGSTIPNPGAPFTPFPGSVDEIRILDQALTAVQISDRYQSFLFGSVLEGVIDDLTSDPPSVNGMVISTDPADGDMTGPNSNANSGRLEAFANRLADAQTMLGSGDTAGACDELRSAETKLNTWFSGAIQQALRDALAQIIADVGCP